MKYLLDTHALLWWWTDDPQLSPVAHACIQNEANTILVSAASAWEIATRHRLGKLSLAGEAVARFNEFAQAPAGPAAGTVAVDWQEAAGTANGVGCAADPIAGGGTPKDAWVRGVETSCCYANGVPPLG